MLCVGAKIVRLCLNLSAFEAESHNMHFQPPAGNEIDKGFERKLTQVGDTAPMSCRGLTKNKLSIFRSASILLAGVQKRARCSHYKFIRYLKNCMSPGLVS